MSAAELIKRLLLALFVLALCAAIIVVYARFWPWPAYGLGLVLAAGAILWAAD